MLWEKNLGVHYFFEEVAPDELKAKTTATEKSPLEGGPPLKAGVNSSVEVARG